MIQWRGAVYSYQFCSLLAENNSWPVRGCCASKKLGTERRRTHRASDKNKQTWASVIIIEAPVGGFRGAKKQFIVFCAKKHGHQWEPNKFPKIDEFHRGSMWSPMKIVTAFLPAVPLCTNKVKVYNFNEPFLFGYRVGQVWDVSHDSHGNTDGLL